MARPPPPKQKDRRPWVVLIVVFVLGIAWCSSEEDPPESTSPSVVFVPTPEPEPESIPAGVETSDAATELDAGPDEPVDAGRPSLARKELSVEDYMRRWREALEPLFRTRKYPGAPTLLRSMPREPEPELPDAGPCEPRVQRLDFIAMHKFDLVIVVDTSGSMRNALGSISFWLAELEKQIVDSRSDTQLLVLADQRSIGRRKSDGGINWQVNSNDALEVLLAGTHSQLDGHWGGLRPTLWVDSLRTGAELQLVVVTDDRSTGFSADEYLARLSRALGGLRFTFHVLGGFQTPNDGLLTSDQPIMNKECSAEGIIGMNAGETYQQLARLTKGLRAPLCNRIARQELSAALLAMPSSTSCGWLLDLPRHRIDGVNAVGGTMPPNRLLEERSLANCAGMRRSYRRADSFLVLCQDSCQELQKDGYEGLEVKLECN